MVGPFILLKTLIVYHADSKDIRKDPVIAASHIFLPMSITISEGDT